MLQRVAPSQFIVPLTPTVSVRAERPRESVSHKQRHYTEESEELGMSGISGRNVPLLWRDHHGCDHPASHVTPGMLGTSRNWPGAALKFLRRSRSRLAWRHITPRLRAAVDRGWSGKVIALFGHRGNNCDSGIDQSIWSRWSTARSRPRRRGSIAWEVRSTSPDWWST